MSVQQKSSFCVGVDWLSYRITSLFPRHSVQEVGDRVKWRKEKERCERRGGAVNSHPFALMAVFFLRSLHSEGTSFRASFSVETCFSREVCIWVCVCSAEAIHSTLRRWLQNAHTLLCASVCLFLACGFTHHPSLNASVSLFGISSRNTCGGKQQEFLVWVNYVMSSDKVKLTLRVKWLWKVFWISLFRYAGCG